jgi:hypothetical protein
VGELETSRMGRPWPALSRSTTAKKKKKNLAALLSAFNENNMVEMQTCATGA